MKSNSFTSLDGSGLRIAVVAARFNQDYTDAMLADCLEGLTGCGVQTADIITYRVPGSFELPVAASVAAQKGDIDAVICLGVIIKGDTRHDHYIADAVANGLTSISLKTGIPVMFGVLTTENKDQAAARSIGGQKKGWEAAMSALETVLTLREIKTRVLQDVV